MASTVRYSRLDTGHSTPDTSNMTPDDLRQQVELKVVELIKAKLEDGSMSEERAQQLSRIALETIKPGMSLEELIKAVAKIDDTAPELAPVVLPLMRDYEENVVKKIQSGVSDLIRHGQYDAAAKLAKQAINQDVSLEWTGSSQDRSPVERV